jgi:hypothetical protein
MNRATNVAAARSHEISIPKYRWIARRMHPMAVHLISP